MYCFFNLNNNNKRPKTIGYFGMSELILLKWLHFLTYSCEGAIVANLVTANFRLKVLGF